MAVLLLAEVSNGELAMDATAKAVTAAKSLGDVTVLCAGASAKAAADTAATIDGVARVLCAEDDALGHRLAEPTAALLVSLAGDYSHIVAPATTDAKNIMPRVAALLAGGRGTKPSRHRCQLYARSRDFWREALFSAIHPVPDGAVQGLSVRWCRDSLALRPGIAGE